MPKAPRLDELSEKKRLDTLRFLNILDSDSEESFDRLISIAKCIFDVPMAVISLIDADRTWFKAKVGIESAEVSRDQAFCSHAIFKKQLHEVSDMTKHKLFRDHALVKGEPHLRFFAGFPISAPNGARIGAFCIFDTKPRSLTDKEKKLLLDIARLIELAIASTGMANTDQLTMLANKRGFEMLGQHTLNISRRNGSPAFLLYFDLDNFKQINDVHGHAVGDNALIKFSHLLSEAFRDSDVIGRIGGDEFVVLMTSGEEQDIARVLARLDRLIVEFHATQQSSYQLAYSFGRVEYDAQQHESISDLVTFADRHMYANKTHTRLNGSQ